MPLTIGARLGHYDIISALGAGGMGEVYRARDTRLGRDVAIKVLPETLSHDAERLARFKREAHVLASLNHPHIAAIYGVEDAPPALVLELVEGPTLADVIAKGPIPLDEALPIARQTAEALEAAHEQGIVHRDLKPANIKLRPDGTVKVLDFGLAKAMSSAAKAAPYGDASESVGRDLSRVGRSQSPTITTPAAMSGTGLILGTAAYMAPEQTRGKPVDKRADIWAFGCVLFEMLAGKRAFALDGDTVTDVFAAVLKTEPDWRALPSSTPASIKRLLRRCLAKDPRERLHDIADARLEIRDAERADTESAPAVRHGRLAWNVVAGLVVLSVVLGWLLVRSSVQPSDQSAVYRSQILPPAGDVNAASSEARTGVPRFGTRTRALA